MLLGLAPQSPRYTKPQLRTGVSTVIVYCKTSFGYYVGAGDIVAESSTSLIILTAKHVIVHNGGLTCKLNNMGVNLFDGSKEHVKDYTFIPDHDLALLVITNPKIAFPIGGWAIPPDANTSLFIWGHPNGHFWLMSPAVTEDSSEYQRYIKDGTYLVNCHTCGHGDSGGGVYTTDGTLVGIVVARLVKDPDTLIVEPIQPAITYI